MDSDTDYYGEDTGSPHKGKDEGTPLTMLSKSVFGGKSISPGDKITLVVKKVHDDEVSVEFTSKGGDKEQPSPATDEAELDEVPEPEAEDLYA